MTSQDVLNLSLDDIIKMKGHSSQRGRGRGWGTTHTRETYFIKSTKAGRGRGQGKSRGRSRGARLLASKFTVQQRGGWRTQHTAAVIGRGGKGGTRAARSYVVQGRRGSSKQNDRGGSTQSRRGKSFQITRGRTAQDGLGEGIQLGRGRRSSKVRSGSNLMRGRGPITRRGTQSQLQFSNQESQQHFTAWDSSFRQRLVRRKIQQARRTLALSQQNNRAKARLSIINTHRGITQGLKTKDNLGGPLQVRVGHGTVVQGLRSDQLLLHRMNHQFHNVSATRRNSRETLNEKTGGSSVHGANSVVSLSTQRCLTVSIKNNIASNQTQHIGSSTRSRPRLNRKRIRQYALPIYAPATFTVVNDQVLSPEQPAAVSPSPRKILKRNIISSMDPRARVAPSIVALPQENLRPVPEPHRQILDPKVQKEIAMLQGKEVSLNNGPGPGVKGFRHIPSHTARSLNERFTEERMITV